MEIKAALMEKLGICSNTSHKLTDWGKWYYHWTEDATLRNRRSGRKCEYMEKRKAEFAYGPMKIRITWLSSICKA